MSVAIPRRGPGNLAGKLCQRKMRGKDNTGTGLCPKYARYAVVWRDDATGRIVVVDGVCGAHVTEAIRETWKYQNIAPAVQEIPGMWRGIE